MKTALIIIDIQNDYFPGGRMELVGAEAAAMQAGEALAFFRSRNLPVIHIRHLSTRPDATFFLPDTDGIEIHPGVAPLPGETVFVKNFPNSFRETPLLEHLRCIGIGRLVLTGMMTSMCVDATARAAFDLGFRNVLLHDAMATRDLAFGGVTVPAAQVHGAFLAALGSVYGRVTGVAEFLAELETEK
ncbi:MAG TPA: cysteine hydrolase family protein [Dongiaceae bacterium]|nr:cysteine hydrolase family protein [Dongiaceae bacterium]